MNQKMLRSVRCCGPRRLSSGMALPEDLHVVWVLATSLEEPLPAGVSAAQTGPVVPLYHLVSEPLELQF